MYLPNFMGIFCMSCLIAIFYFIVSVKNHVYGDINYIAYMITYAIVLFSTCIVFYKTDRY